MAFDSPASSTLERDLIDTPLPAGEPRPSTSEQRGSKPAAAALAEKPASAPPPRSRKRFIIALVALAALAGGGYYGWSWWTTGRFVVSTDDAYVRADMSIIAAKVSGYVATVTANDNQAVKAGDLLATIDAGDYKLAVDAARGKIETQNATIARLGEQARAQQAMVDQARAGVESSQADAKRAALEFDRSNSLARSGFGTPQRVEQALADRDRTAAMISSANAALAGAQANLAVMKAQKIEAERLDDELRTALARAERDLSFTLIRAPFDGVVGNRAAQPGQFVQAGTRLLALVPLDTAYVEANFKETQLARLKPGQTATFTVDSIGGRSFEGIVESVAPAAGSQFSLLPPENATGNFTKIVQRVPVRIRAPTDAVKDSLLRPGLSVTVDVMTRDPATPTPTPFSFLEFKAH